MQRINELDGLAFQIHDDRLNPRRVVLCITSEGIATARPAAVVSNASEIPPASALALPVPWVVISVNTLIMPTTVPSSPISGVMAAMVPSALR